MISHTFKQAVYDAGIAIDMFGQKLSVGDYVLCKSSGSCDKDHIAIVKKVNRKSVVIDLMKYTRSYGRYNPRPANHTGPWTCYPDFKITASITETRRNPLDMLRIPASFYADIMAAEESLTQEFPELAI